jgi:hypothetical protein
MQGQVEDLSRGWPTWQVEDLSRGWPTWIKANGVTAKAVHIKTL